jgi:hypothetical protein
MEAAVLVKNAQVTPQRMIQMRGKKTDFTNRSLHYHEEP